MWVLLLSIPFVFIFNFFDEHSIHFFGKEYSIGPELLIRIPENLLDSILYPDFSMIGTGAFWMTVMSITLVASVETLASARAVDKLDPYNRVTNLNKDLVSVGLSTMVSGALGGLPIITVIVRSTVNVQNNAKTKWSNLYHGLILILFILILAPVLQNVPLAALAAILVYTGFKLASPNSFYNSYDQGVEQLLFMVSTLIITLLRLCFSLSSLDRWLLQNFAFVCKGALNLYFLCFLGLLLAFQLLDHDFILLSSQS